MNLRLKTFLWNPACHSLVARKYVFGVTWKLFFISFKGVCIWVYITAAPFTTLTGIVGSLGFSHILSGVLSSQVCGGCAFDMHFPSAEVKRLYVLDVLTQFFSFLFWRNMCSGLLFILTFFFAVFYWVFLDLSHFVNLPFTGQNCTSHPPSYGSLFAL